MVTGVVDQENGTVTVVVPFGTDLTSLVPTIGIDARSITPASGVARDFTGPVTYTITSFSGLTRDYTVTVLEGIDLRLSSLVLTDGGSSVGFNPPFGGDEFSYHANVDNDVVVITVTPHAASGSVDITVDPSPTDGSIPLAEGANPIRITVTNPDRGTTLTYAVTVDRAFELAMVSVPTGSFQRDEIAANVSAVAAFSMCAREITRAQFVSVTGRADPSRTEFSTGLDNPVQFVSWFEALVFANRLSIRRGFTPVYTISGETNPDHWPTIPTTFDQSNLAAWNAVTADWAVNGYRLPTEMEWMWAAMGALPGDGDEPNRTGWEKPFAGSSGINSIGDYTWYVENSDNTTRRVGTRSANELGLFDMSGNVKEWVWDRHQPTLPEGALSSDYSGPETGELRVLRGGAFRDPADQVTVASRTADFPYGTGSSNGFRVVRRP
jgi:formylglycine-generating enzyme required for sulfatase activity